ncbi:MULTISPECIES: hypothetical protein [unclassified Aureimonas]|uniref:hypothetical protein n=1 Tax=unclassified Aureimonas TaxID=2615206 RepID=UPI0006FC2A2A|nr:MULTISPECIES: hypothetical protein [unclassified Aureimonas]KQT62565.1 hypothetical protein ASG62_22865 [Aureimonas sp. Leaf427]KQT73207.1 hypothetical protein ASG54_18160 [Aureimonas sp. Leaf460]
MLGGANLLEPLVPPHRSADGNEPFKAANDEADSLFPDGRPDLHNEIIIAAAILAPPTLSDMSWINVADDAAQI